MACLSARARYIHRSRSAGGLRLAWVIILAVLMASRSFFIRQLLAALLLFTMVFVTVATLIVVFVLIDDVVSWSLGWLESEARSVRFMHFSVASPARVPTLWKNASRRTKALNHG